MILIDFSAMAIANVLVNKLTIDEDHIRHMILNSIRLHRLKHKKKYGEVVLAIDAAHNWRKDIFPQYKHSRTKARADQQVDWAEIYRILNIVLKELEEHFPYKIVKVDKCEADDVIGELCRYTNTFGNFENVLIVSSDKDFVQLHKFKNVQQWSLNKKAFYKVDDPLRFSKELIIRGDRDDGVPNVLSSDNCFVDGIQQNSLYEDVLDKLILDPKSQGTDVHRNYWRNKTLIDLESTPKELKEKIINTFEGQDPSNNKNKVFKFLMDKRCRLLLESAGDFTQ